MKENKTNKKQNKDSKLKQKSAKASNKELEKLYQEVKKTFEANKVQPIQVTGFFGRYFIEWLEKDKIKKQIARRRGSDNINITELLYKKAEKEILKRFPKQKKGVLKELNKITYEKINELYLIKKKLKRLEEISNERLNVFLMISNNEDLYECKRKDIYFLTNFLEENIQIKNDSISILNSFLKTKHDLELLGNITKELEDECISYYKKICMDLNKIEEIILYRYLEEK